MKTIKIRIPVAVDYKGRWYAYGWSNGDASGPKNHDELLEVTDVDQIGPSESLHWIEAELPIPEITMLAGQVVS